MGRAGQGRRSISATPVSICWRSRPTEEATALVPGVSSASTGGARLTLLGDKRRPYPAPVGMLSVTGRAPQNSLSLSCRTRSPYAPRGLRSPRRPLAGTPHDVAVLARPCAQVRQCVCLAQRDTWGGRRHDRGPATPIPAAVVSRPPDPERERGPCRGSVNFGVGHAGYVTTRSLYKGIMSSARVVAHYPLNCTTSSGP